MQNIKLPKRVELFLCSNDLIQLIIYIEFLNLGGSLPLIIYLYIPITYENQKIKIQETLPKVVFGCLRCTLKLTSIRDCSRFPPSLPSHPLLTLKDKAADRRIFVPTRKGQSVSNVMEVGKGKRKQSTIKRLAYIIIVHPN